MANETVTISAEWFDELREKAKGSMDCDNCKEVHTRIKERDDALKERDELKAKLEESERSVESLDAALVNDERLKTAERCLEEIEKWIGEPNWLVDSRASNVIRNIIRAWREKREAK